MKDSINFRRHKNACEHYRERWLADDVGYQIICLKGTPPLTAEEQRLCFDSRTTCWREGKNTPASEIAGESEVSTGDS